MTSDASSSFGCLETGQGTLSAFRESRSWSVTALNCTPTKILGLNQNETDTLLIQAQVRLYVS